MLIKKIGARKIRNSRGEFTIQVFVKTGFFKKFKTSSPAGKSTGKYEVKPYKINLNSDIKTINSFDIPKINKLNISGFSDLLEVERLIKNKIGGNSLYALEASILKALAYENKKELWEFLEAEKKDNLRIRPVGNAIGGGLHSKGINGKKPDFQEFLFIAEGNTFTERVKVNNIAYKLAGKLLNSKYKNDESAWETNASNEKVLMVMNKVKQILKQKNMIVDIGIDCASSSFYKNGFYNYKNRRQVLKREEQISYINNLINNYKIFYIEDPLNENDFKGFAELRKKCKNCLIVGDDLTTTNPSRFEKAIKNKSINAIIVKPNQIGSLLKTKEVIDLAKEKGIKTIISHRSGETKDNTIADLGAGWGCDFIKTGIYGDVREAKLKRVMKIRKK